MVISMRNEFPPKRHTLVYCLRLIEIEVSLGQLLQMTIALLLKFFLQALTKGLSLSGLFPTFHHPSLKVAKLLLNDGETVRLGPSQVRWVQEEDVKETSDFMVNLPVYLNGDRSDVLFTLDLPFDSAVASLVATRAVCLTAGG